MRVHKNSKGTKIAAGIMALAMMLSLFALLPPIEAKAAEIPIYLTTLPTSGSDAITYAPYSLSFR